MWVLQQLNEQDNESGIPFLLLHGRSYIIGRKDCDIVLNGDATISRKHAVLEIKKRLDDEEVAIVDKSKVGVYVNKIKVQPNQEIKIKANDVIVFGKYSVNFMLKQIKINAVLSGISGSESKRNCKSLIHRLGGKTSNDWNLDTTHLIMEKLTFTIKVVCALASGKYIVTPKYFEDVFDSFNKKQGKIPLEKSYLPSIAEKSLLKMESLFTPDIKRQSLMEGKQLVVLSSNQYMRIQLAFELAGGNVVLKTKHDTAITKSLSAEQTLVLQTEKKDDLSSSNEENNWKEVVYQKLKSHSLRPIRESEIGLAILYASLQSFCNPTNAKAPKISTSHSQLITDTFVTQTMQEESQLLLESSESLNSSECRKRKAPEQEVLQDSPVTKKLKVLSTESTSLKNKPKAANIVSLEEDDASFSEASFEENLFNFKSSAQTKKKNSTNFNISDKNDFWDCSQIFDIDKEIKMNKQKVNGFSESIIPESELIKNSTFDENSINDISTTKRTGLLFSLCNNSVTNDDKSSFCSFSDKSKIQLESARVPSAQAKHVTNKVGLFDFNSQVTNVVSKEFVIPDTDQNDDNVEFLEVVERQLNCTKVDLQNKYEQKDVVLSIDKEKNVKYSTQGIKSPQTLKSNSANDRTWLGKTYCNDDSRRIESSSYNDEAKSNNGVISSRQPFHKAKEKKDTQSQISLPTAHLFYGSALIEDHKKNHDEPPMINMNHIYTSCQNKKSSVKKEEDSTLDHLMQTSFVSLVVNSIKTRSIDYSYPGSLKKPRNFKVFRKQRYVGCDKSTRDIIRRDDLVVYKNANENQDSVFDDFKEENDREEEAEKEMNRLFDNWGNNKEPARKIKRR